MNLAYICLSHPKSLCGFSPRNGHSFLQVTYTVRYNLEIMSQSASDDDVEQRLGNYDLIRNNVGAIENDLSAFYTFQPSDQHFSFAGETEVTLVDLLKLRPVTLPIRLARNDSF